MAYSINNRCNCSILSVGFATIGQLLNYKLAEAGGFYLESPTRSLKPTQRCVKCWELTPKTLADRMHICSNSNCCHVEDRDVNAAQVNLTWARGKLRAGASAAGGFPSVGDWRRVPPLSPTFQDRGQELSSSDAESSSSTSCGSMRQLGALKRQKPRSNL